MNDLQKPKTCPHCGVKFDYDTDCHVWIHPLINDCMHSFLRLYSGLREMSLWNRRASDWVPVEERLPTEEDADKYGCIEAWSTVLPSTVTMRIETFTEPDPRRRYRWWRRIDNPEGCE